MHQNVTLRGGFADDVTAIAEIWRLGWRDGHLGLVPRELAEARTDESFRARAAERVGETTVAVVDGEIAGLVMVVDDEVEHVSAAHRGIRVADALMREDDRRALPPLREARLRSGGRRVAR